MIIVSIKDGSYHVQGMPSRNGSILFNNDGLDKESCLIVEKLINAGAIIVGRTTMPEYILHFINYFDISIFKFKVWMKMVMLF